MGFGKREESSADVRWLHVKKGELINHTTGEAGDYVTGVVTGVRIQRNEKFGGLELHVRVFDELEGEHGTLYIISGGLTNPDQSTQTWARMLVARLADAASQSYAGDRLRFEFYGLDTDFGIATCCALKLETDPTALPGQKIDRMDVTLLGKLLEQVQDRYAWQGQRSLPSSEIAGALDAEVVSDETTTAEEVAAELVAAGDDVPPPGDDDLQPI